MTRPSSLPGRAAAWVRRHPRIALLLVGAISALAMPPINAVPVLWLSFPVLFMLVADAKTPLSAAFRAWLFGTAHYVFGLYWITEAILFEAAQFWWAIPTAVPALSATLALFIAGPAALAWVFRRDRVAMALVLAGAWVLGDIARAFVATGFPWDPFGSVWVMGGLVGLVMIQFASVVGVYGLTWLTVLVAVAPALGRRAMVAAVAALGVWAAFGVVRTGGAAPDAPGVAVVLVQGNAQEDQKWSPERVGEFFAAYLEQTRAGVAQARAMAPRVVTVWPETASPYLLEAEPRARAAIAAASLDTVVLAGTERFGADGRPRNTLLAVLAGGGVGPAYDKWHLVPFGEFQPSWFPLPFQIVQRGGFQSGDGPAVMDLPGLPPVGPFICYEAIYSGQITGAERPEWLVNVTNDAWYGNGSGPRQHLAAARLRAVEAGLPLMRAANTGITAGFDAFGRELGRLSQNVRGRLVLKLPGAAGPTPYFRFGLAVPVLIALLSLAAGVTLRARRADARIIL